MTKINKRLVEEVDGESEKSSVRLDTTGTVL